MIGSKYMEICDGAEYPRASSNIISAYRYTFALTALVIAGLFLRLWCARGDLWLDEIWSYRLAAQARNLPDILFALPYDNNHLLNTLWLKLVGADVPSWITRLPAILYGTMSILAAALTGRRDGKSGAIIFALIFATDFAFLDFESEARGYAGLILAFLAGFHSIENLIGDIRIKQNLFLFSFSICFGALSHLTMAEPAGVFCLHAAVLVLRRDGRNIAAARKIIRIFAAAALGIAPVLVCVAVSLSRGVLHVGRITPFSLDGFTGGLALMISATLGFPDDARRFIAAPGLLLVLTGLLTGLIRYIPRQRRLFYVLTIVVLPLVHIALHVRNMQIARFHLTTALALAMLGAEILAVAWTRSRLSRNFALAAILGFLICQAAVISRFGVSLRGDYSGAAALMSQNGPSTFMVIPELVQGETAAVVRWYSTVPRLLEASRDPDCSHPADWTLENVPANQVLSPSQTMTIKTGDCGWTYQFAKAFPSFGLSGYSWLLYSVQK